MWSNISRPWNPSFRPGVTCWCWPSPPACPPPITPPPSLPRSCGRNTPSGKSTPWIPCAPLWAKGKTIDEVRDWAVGHKLSICHQFTVDDLHFLKRGGRISSTTAFVGSMLQIKPVLHVDNDGKLMTVAKARGRRAALKALVDRMEQTAIDLRDQTVFISHGDCLEDAQLVAQLVKDRFGVKDVYMNYVGPVVGAHAGPGVLALFYVGVER